MTEYLTEIVSTRVVEEATSPLLWESRHFTFTKKDTVRLRVILDLNMLNTYINPLVTGEASAARRYVPGEFGLTSAMRRGATRRVTFATARPLYVPGGRGNICPGPATIVVDADMHTL